MDTTILLELTADIVSAHVGHNRVEPVDVPHLIQSVYGAALHGVHIPHARRERSASRGAASTARLMSGRSVSVASRGSTAQAGMAAKSQAQALQFAGLEVNVRPLPTS